MLISFSPFLIKKSLRLTAVRGTCFLKPQETGVLDVVSRSRGMLEQFSDVVDEGFLNLQSNLYNSHNKKIMKTKSV